MSVCMCVCLFFIIIGLAVEMGAMVGAGERRSEKEWGSSIIQRKSSFFFLVLLKLELLILIKAVLSRRREGR